jgi:4,5-dihydroxyphthalate decarboxylase
MPRKARCKCLSPFEDERLESNGILMSKLQLSIAIGDYDRMRALVDGQVQIDGVDPQIMLLDPEEIFFRAFRHADFDICELSLSSYSVKMAAGTSPYIAVPVFPSRAFRHTSVYVRSDRIKSPADLKGRRVGVPEYQLTANIWVRLFLEEDFGIRPSDIIWVRGGYEHPGRIEKIGLNLPSDVTLENAPADATISDLLAKGDVDAVIGPRAPSCFDQAHPNIGYLFADPQKTAIDWYRRTRIFPIMHTLGIRRSLVEKHSWLAVAVYKAFERSKAIALAKLSDTSATKVTMPFVEEQLRAARQLMGEDFWAYGLEPNRHVLSRFLARHHAEGLSSRLLAPEELFHPASTELHKI